MQGDGLRSLTVFSLPGNNLTDATGGALSDLFLPFKSLRFSILLIMNILKKRGFLSAHPIKKVCAGFQNLAVDKETADCRYFFTKKRGDHLCPG
jgi:hypothetical protein